eukprot:2115227-Alexandrium_andersonii.AAC.1
MALINDQLAGKDQLMAKQVELEDMMNLIMVKMYENPDDWMDAREAKSQLEGFCYSIRHMLNGKRLQHAFE